MRTAPFTCGQSLSYTKQNAMHYCKSLALERKPHTMTWTVFVLAPRLLEYSKPMHLAEAPRSVLQAEQTWKSTVTGQCCIQRAGRPSLSMRTSEMHRIFCTVTYRLYMTFFQGLLLNLAHIEDVNWSFSVNLLNYENIFNTFWTDLDVHLPYPFFF